MRYRLQNRIHRIPAHSPSTAFNPGYDPELMIVECARCGQPVLWERGRATEMLAGVGIDPLELDAHCLFLTDGCARCSPEKRGKFNVQVFRVVPGQGQIFGVKSGGTA